MNSFVALTFPLRTRSKKVSTSWAKAETSLNAQLPPEPLIVWSALKTLSITSRSWGAFSRSRRAASISARSSASLIPEGLPELRNDVFFALFRITSVFFIHHFHRVIVICMEQIAWNSKMSRKGASKISLSDDIGRYGVEGQHATYGV
jgi:hypothetical protein